MSEINKLRLPCIRGRMGDWMYYVTLLSFKEVANRVRLPKEIDIKYKNQENLKLGEWIQRELQAYRTKEIVSYLKTQDQRFFNSLILGMYDGKPQWSEINVKSNSIYNDEEEVDYLSKTFGILTLTGKESIFAIDGQHRAFSIREALNEDKSLENDEICAIFVAHKATDEGKLRTRRLFSTLNRYAKPVNKKEIIALSEDDNCAILVRRLVENHPLFKDKILISGNKSVSPNSFNHFTSIISLYETIEVLLTEKTILGFKTKGHEKISYTNTRVSDEQLDKDYEALVYTFEKIINSITSLKSFFINNKKIIRSNLKTNLIFRPIGQKIFFDVYKICLAYNKEEEFLSFFNSIDFSLNNKVWKKVFWDEETRNILPETKRQRYAALLLLERFGFEIKRTKRDDETYENFAFSASDIK